MKKIKTYEAFTGITATIDQKGRIVPNGVKNMSSKKTIYNPDWEKYLPEEMSINYHGDIYTFKRGNIMLVGDLVEITYYLDLLGVPDTLEFDLYFVKDSNLDKMRINIDITFGDLMACEFAVESPDKVILVQDTTLGSKFDPSNTIFALTDKSLKEFIEFLNKFDGFKLDFNSLEFLKNK
jgi:hypothetical protein